MNNTNKQTLTLMLSSRSKKQQQRKGKAKEAHGLEPPRPLIHFDWLVGEAKRVK
jgi:hypothetical protein